MSQCIKKSENEYREGAVRTEKNERVLAEGMSVTLRTPFVREDLPYTERAVCSLCKEEIEKDAYTDRFYEYLCLRCLIRVHRV